MTQILDFQNADFPPLNLSPGRRSRRHCSGDLLLERHAQARPPRPPPSTRALRTVTGPGACPPPPPPSGDGTKGPSDSLRQAIPLALPPQLGSCGIQRCTGSFTLAPSLCKWAPRVPYQAKPSHLNRDHLIIDLQSNHAILAPRVLVIHILGLSVQKVAPCSGPCSPHALLARANLPSDASTSHLPPRYTGKHDSQRPIRSRPTTPQRRGTEVTRTQISDGTIVTSE